ARLRRVGGDGGERDQLALREGPDPEGRGLVREGGVDGLLRADGVVRRAGGAGADEAREGTLGGALARQRLEARRDVGGRVEVEGQERGARVGLDLLEGRETPLRGVVLPGARGQQGEGDDRVAEGR